MNTILFALLSFFLVNESSSSLSEDRTWDGEGGDQQWMNPLNWDNDLIPEFDADVLIITDDTVYLSGVNITIESLTLQGGADLIIEEDAILNTYKGGPNGSDAVHMEGDDSLGVETTLTVMGSLLIDMHGASGDGLDMNKFTMTTVTSTGLLQIIHTGDDGLEIADDFINHGTVVIQDTDQDGITFSSVIEEGATIWNAPGAIMNIDTTGKKGIELNSDLLFNNEGILRVSNCTQQVLKGSSYSFSNNGTFIAAGIVDTDVFSNNASTTIEAGPHDSKILTFEEAFNFDNTILNFDLNSPSNGNSPTPGLNHDQIEILDGEIDLTQCIFGVNGSYVPVEGDEFVLINNMDSSPIMGTLDGFPEGSAFGFNGTELTLSYVGGDGNDVTLAYMPVVIPDNDEDGFNADEDCDDNNPDVNPGAMEIPNNGIDDDCMNGDSISISVQELKTLAVNVYPNPVIDFLQIEYPDASEAILSVFDLRGKLLLERTIRKKASVDFSEFTEGVYIVKIQEGKQFFEERILKVKE